MNQQKQGWQYQAVDISTGVADADPHRLIQMLYDGALKSIAIAKGCIERKDVEAKGVAIGKAIGLVGGLRDSLNHDIVDGGLADNLSALYEYVSNCLLKANASDDQESLESARMVLHELKAGWDGIRAEATSNAPTKAATVLS